jgi:hypothetical protein
MDTITGGQGVQTLLSFARRSGKLLLGLDTLLPLLKRGKKLVVFADPEVSERTLRQLDEAANAYGNSRFRLLSDFRERTAFLGRSGVKIVAVGDPAFRKGLAPYLKHSTEGVQGDCKNKEA